MKRGASALDFREDVGGLGGPDEWFWGVVMLGEVSGDGRNQFVEAFEDGPAEAIDREVTKEAYGPV